MPCCCQCSILCIFLKQIFDFGYSAGSLISEIIGLFKLFQRLSAPKSFVIVFSKDALKYFSWAADFIDLCTNMIDTTPLNEVELFSIYSYIFPLSILMYMASLEFRSMIYLNLIIYGIFFASGIGFGFIGLGLEGNIIAFFVIPVTVLTIALGMLCYYKVECCSECEFLSMFSLKDKNIHDKYETKVPFSLSFITASFFFTLFMIPIMSSREMLAIAVMASIFIIFALLFIIELIINCPKKTDDIDVYKPYSFLINFLTLFIIPSMQSFINLINSKYDTNWRYIVCYISFSLILPIVIILGSILSKSPSINNKYKSDKKFYPYVELIDIFRQMAYAAFAIFDLVYVCLIIEIAWLVFICLLRPYSSYSDYPLSIGNSIVTIITNISLMYCMYSKNGKLNFGVSMFIVVLAFIPAIIAMYVFFLYDLSFDEDEVLNEEQLKESIGVLSIVTRIIVPFAWLFYGILLPLLINYNGIADN